MAAEEDAAEPAPVRGPVPDGAREAAARDGRPLREIAAGMFGAERVDAEWHPDSWMRSKVRRLRLRARTASGAGRDPGGAGDR